MRLRFLDIEKHTCREVLCSTPLGPVGTCGSRDGYKHGGVFQCGEAASERRIVDVWGEAVTSAWKSPWVSCCTGLLGWAVSGKWCVDSVHSVSPAVMEQVGWTAKHVSGHASGDVNRKDSFWGFTDVYRVTVDVLPTAVQFIQENWGERPTMLVSLEAQEPLKAGGLQNCPMLPVLIYFSPNPLLALPLQDAVSSRAFNCLCLS